MELPKGPRRCQMAIILAGILLSCVLQLGAAQRISVILEPLNPQEGQDVTLSVRGGPKQFQLCDWSRDTHQEESEPILEYIPGQSPQKNNRTALGGRATVKGDCSLHITKLRQSDTGNYSVFIEMPTTRQDQELDHQEEESYEGWVYLKVSASNQISVTVLSIPQNPSEGQQVTLTPQGTPQKFEFCEWFEQDTFGNLLSIIQYRPKNQEVPQDTDLVSKGEFSVGQGCSLRITQLTTSDSGTYVVKMQVLLDRQQQQPGQGSRPQEPRVIQEYRGQVELQVKPVSSKDPHKGGYNHSAGLSYSAGVVMGALLGFFAWTDTLTSIFYGLCSALSCPGRLL